MKTTYVRTLLGGAVAASLLLAPGLASAHPGQHGPTSGHLLGAGAFGNIELLSVEEVTQTADLVADVAVSPDGQWAFLANWGEPDCAGPETGGQTTPDAGAWVIDISDLGDPKTVGFIAAHQDSRPGEGMQVVNITTKQFSGDILVMNNEQCGKNGKGGVSLWDVTNPRKPVMLSEHFGDRGGVAPGDSNDIHSSFAWDTGPNAYVIIVDNFETTDVDILDITNPKRPRLIAELDLGAMFPQITQDVPDNLTEVFLHDMVVKKIGSDWIMLLSYWDGGYVQLNVNDPAHPTLIGDTDYEEIDPLLFEATGIEAKPEGNGHQNEFTSDNKFFIGTDEDFAPFGITGFEIATGGFAGPYPSSAVGGAAAVASLSDQEMNGLVVYGGYGCPNSAPVPTPESIPGYNPDPLLVEEKIIVLQRGPVGDPSAPEGACFPGEKAHEAVLAGWDAVLFVERHEGAESPPFCGSGAFVDDIVGLCTTHEVLHRLFNTGPFDGPYAFSAYPDGPAIGAVSVDKISAFADFDGWGYVHLFGNTLDASTGKFPELDTFAIPEAHQEDKGIGFGDLSVHEVATDPQNPNLAYLSYYAGGLRSLEIDCKPPNSTTKCELVEVGGYLDPNGNNFWGVEAFIRGDDTIILGSDRDSGLWIFRRTD